MVETTLVTRWIPLQCLFLSLLVLSCLVIADTVSAQVVVDHPRELTFEPLEFEPPSSDRHRHTLSNGVVVFLVEDHTLPLVTVSVVVRTGSYLDPLGKEGLAG